MAEENGGDTIGEWFLARVQFHFYSMVAEVYRDRDAIPFDFTNEMYSQAIIDAHAIYCALFTVHEAPPNRHAIYTAVVLFSRCMAGDRIDQSSTEARRKRIDFLLDSIAGGIWTSKRAKLADLTYAKNESVRKIKSLKQSKRISIDIVNAPPLFSKRTNKKSAICFFREFWVPLITGAFTPADLKNHDPQLYNVLTTWCSRNKITLKQLIAVRGNFEPK